MGTDGMLTIVLLRLRRAAELARRAQAWEMHSGRAGPGTKDGMKIRLPTAMAVRSIRLVGGIVLMAYVTGHLTTLVFGLVSLNLLDRLRVPMMSP
jgi:hypothetical protein